MKRGALFLTLTAVMVLALLAGATAASAQSERILNFKSFIKVHPDASMTVTEDITVQATGQEIKRGIIRDFPTTYRDRLGNTVTVGFKVEEVLRDGRSEPYQTESVSNGVKIRIGQKDVFLRSGQYTYTIRYRVDRELGFFKDFDELYWNVTGNGWTFAIDRAEAYIELPAGAKILKSAAYTGYQGDRGHDFTVRADDNLIVFKTTRPLASQRGPHRGGVLAQGRGARALQPGAYGLLLSGQCGHGHRAHLAGRAPGVLSLGLVPGGPGPGRRHHHPAVLPARRFFAGGGAFRQPHGV